MAVALVSTSALHAVAIATNTNGGFGSVLSNSAMDFSDDGTTLTISWATGGGAFNDNLVIYFDTVLGGAVDTSSFTDIADGGRAAISGNGMGGGESVLTFAAGFAPDFALSSDSGFAGVFGGLSANHTFVADGGLSGAGTGGDPYLISILLADIGVTPGDSFGVAATYLNSGNAFRSDEAFESAGLGADNPGNNPATFTGFDTINTVPEPSSVSLLGLGGLALLVRRRR